MRRIISNGKDPNITKYAELMSKPSITVNESTSLYNVSYKIVTHKIMIVPVVKDNNTLVGIVTVTDIIKYYYIFIFGSVNLRAYPKIILL